MAVRDAKTRAGSAVGAVVTLAGLVIVVAAVLLTTSFADDTEGADEKFGQLLGLVAIGVGTTTAAVGRIVDAVTRDR